MNYICLYFSSVKYFSLNFLIIFIFMFYENRYYSKFLFYFLLKILFELGEENPFI